MIVFPFLGHLVYVQQTSEMYLEPYQILVLGSAVSRSTDVS